MKPRARCTLNSNREYTNRGSVERNLCYVTRETRRENESGIYSIILK